MFRTETGFDLIDGYNRHPGGKCDSRGRAQNNETTLVNVASSSSRSSSSSSSCQKVGPAGGPCTAATLLCGAAGRVVDVAAVAGACLSADLTPRRSRLPAALCQVVTGWPALAVRTDTLRVLL
eukprot:COSAG06_NODE_2781_length_6296_cov_1.825077_3_plen_123_part_00